MNEIVASVALLALGIFFTYIVYDLSRWDKDREKK